jgi:hypothetical protein
MSSRDLRGQLRHLAAFRAHQAAVDARGDLIPLSVAAAIAYARLVGDASDVSDSAVLQERLDRIALALSAVATIYSGASREDLFLRKDELAGAIGTLRRAGIAFNA